MARNAIKERFAQLQAERKAITDVSYPLRQQRADILNKARAEAEALAVQFKEAEIGLFEIDQELGLLAKALGGRALSDANPQ